MSKEKTINLEMMRKGHLTIYFCINEISHILEEKNQKALSTCINEIYSSLNTFFEISSKYFTHKFITSSQKGVTNSSKVQLVQAPEAMAALGSEELEELEEAKILVKEKRKQEAIKQFYEDAKKVKTLDFREAEIIKREEAKKKKELEEKIQRCIFSIHADNDDYFQYMFEPQVILETSKRVLDQMLEKGDLNEEVIRDMVKSINKHSNVTGGALDEADFIRKDLDRLQIVDLEVKKLNKRYMQESFVEDVLNETEQGLATLLDKKTRKIARKALYLYRKATERPMEDGETQTQDDQTVNFLKGEIIALKNAQSKVDKMQSEKQEAEKKRLIDKLVKLEKELDYNKKRVAEYRTQLVQTQGGLREQKSAFENEHQMNQQRMQFNEELMGNIDEQQSIEVEKLRKMKGIKQIALFLMKNLEMIEMSKSAQGEEEEDSDDEDSKMKVISFIQKGPNSLFQLGKAVNDGLEQILEKDFKIDKELSQSLLSSRELIIERLEEQQDEQGQIIYVNRATNQPIQKSKNEHQMDPNQNRMDTNSSGGSPLKFKTFSNSVTHGKRIKSVKIKNAETKKRGSVYVEDDGKQNAFDKARKRRLSSFNQKSPKDKKSRFKTNKNSGKVNNGEVSGSISDYTERNSSFQDGDGEENQNKGTKYFEQNRTLVEESNDDSMGEHSGRDEKDPKKPVSLFYNQKNKNSNFQKKIRPSIKSADPEYEIREREVIKVIRDVINSSEMEIKSKKRLKNLMDFIFVAEEQFAEVPSAQTLDSDKEEYNFVSTTTTRKLPSVKQSSTTAGHDKSENFQNFPKNSKGQRLSKIELAQIKRNTNKQRTSQIVQPRLNDQNYNMYLKEKFDNSEEKNLQRNLMSKTLDSTNFNSQSLSSQLNMGKLDQIDMESLKLEQKDKGLHRRSISIPYHISYNASREKNCSRKHHENGNGEVKQYHKRSSSYFNPKINSYTPNKTLANGDRKRDKRGNKTLDNSFGRHREQSQITEEENTQQIEHRYKEIENNEAKLQHAKSAAIKGLKEIVWQKNRTGNSNKKENEILQKVEKIANTVEVQIQINKENAAQLLKKRTSPIKYRRDKSKEEKKDLSKIFKKKNYDQSEWFKPTSIIPQSDFQIPQDIQRNVQNYNFMKASRADIDIIAGNVAEKYMSDHLFKNQKNPQQFNSKSIRTEQVKAFNKYKNMVKKEFQGFQSQHKGCGDNCPHLLRFYERLAILFDKQQQNNRQAYKMSRISIDDLGVLQ